MRYATFGCWLAEAFNSCVSGAGVACQTAQNYLAMGKNHKLYDDNYHLANIARQRLGQAAKKQKALDKWHRKSVSALYNASGKESVWLFLDHEK
jgi:hypothetical protein